MRKTVLFLILILITTTSVSASQFVMPLPSTYGDKVCELVAKDFIKAFPGSGIIFLQPFKDNGDYDLGEYNGHFLNVRTIHGQDYYIDYQTQSIFTSKEKVLSWYNNMLDSERAYFFDSETGKKLDKNGKSFNSKSELFDLRYNRPSFPMVWHY